MDINTSQEKKRKIFFVWHWFKRADEFGALAVLDSLVFAIQKLAFVFDVRIVCLAKDSVGDYYSEEQGVKYYFCRNIEEIVEYLEANRPEVIFLNHHPKSYFKLLGSVNKIKALKIIYYSSPIKYSLVDRFKYLWEYKSFWAPINYRHKKIEYHVVHHVVHKKQLQEVLNIAENRIYVSPKTANLDVFKPMLQEKKWDCVYPGRIALWGWKRGDLALEACRNANKTLALPGANVPSGLPGVAYFDKWLSHQELAVIMNQSRCLLITSNYIEMGPRVICEAAACNIPIVCCADSPAACAHIKNIGGFIAKPNADDIAKKIEIACRTICNTREQLFRLGYTFDLNYRTILEILKREKLDLDA